MHSNQFNHFINYNFTSDGFGTFSNSFDWRDLRFQKALLMTFLTQLHSILQNKAYTKLLQLVFFIVITLRPVIER